jgi:hypothetical protein
MTFDDVRKLALAWPEVEDGTSKITVLLSPDDTQETPIYKGFFKLAS